ncbi:phage terminase small subunit [Bifidobacterium myosotis]|uniref:phage terminase small subunit n=1 Tax=Bifidobacterium myosotis TaxID=1630166 RepID=UPI001CC28883|nr:hypothetical protein [Bifidobacterium myosotis]
MAGNGHAGRSKPGKGVILESPDEPLGLPLPSVRPDGREWNSLTKRWYESMRTGPMAPIMGAQADWYSLLDLAMLKDDFYSMPKKSAVMAAEIRQREESFGITPAARIKLKINDRTPDDTSVGAAHSQTRGDAVAEEVRRRRSQLRVVNGGA